MESQEWDRRYAGAELVWTAEPNRFVVDELRDLAPGQALDAGAGEGRNAVWLAARGWQVTAVDFSAVGLDKSRRLAGARGVAVDWVRADVRDYQPEPGSFQLVLVAYLQLRAAELDGVLRRAILARSALLPALQSDLRGRDPPQAGTLSWTARGDSEPHALGASSTAAA